MSPIVQAISDPAGQPACCKTTNGQQAGCCGPKNSAAAGTAAVDFQSQLKTALQSQQTALGPSGSADGADRAAPDAATSATPQAPVSEPLAVRPLTGDIDTRVSPFAALGGLRASDGAGSVRPQIVR